MAGRPFLRKENDILDKLQTIHDVPDTQGHHQVEEVFKDHPHPDEPDCPGCLERQAGIR